jgi:hypothetical protein
MIDAAERESMLQTARAAVAGADGSAAADEALARIGWLELLAAEPGDAIEIVFSTLGSSNATATALDDVLASALGMKPSPELAVLLPLFASWEPPGPEGLATARAATAKEFLVSGGALPRTAVELRAVSGIDPSAGFFSVRVREGAARTRDLDKEAWQRAVALGRRAVAHQIAGASRAMLELARSHALERVQFGRPIARFQAVRHRLADALVAVESLEAALSAAREQPSAETAALAKAIAGRTARSVAAHCQQVLAGIGFTTEHPFHRFLKRTLALEGLFGSADEIALDLGRQLLAARRVPTLIEL